MIEKVLMSGAVLLAAGVLFAGNGRKLDVNGDFGGAKSGAATAPGWVTDDDSPGAVRLLPDKKGRFIQEISAANSPKSVSGDFVPVTGNRVKVEVEYSGTGTGALSCFFYNSMKRLVVMKGDTRQLTLQAWRKGKFTFNLPESTAYIRLVMTAGGGAKALFRDLEAESFYEAPAPNEIPAPTAAAAKDPARVVRAPRADPKELVKPDPNGIRLLNRQRFLYREVADRTVYLAYIPAGQELTFYIGEDFAQNLTWNLYPVDPSLCRVQIAHTREGVPPLNSDQAMISLKSMTGKSYQIDFYCGTKRISVLVNSK